MSDLAARLTALSPTLRRACEAEPRPHDPHVLFHLLTRDVERRLRDGDHAVLPSIFAELEHALADPALADPAARLLEDLPAPDAHVHLLPWLGPRALAFLRAWEAGPRDPYLSPAQADALLAPLAAACPAVARGWPRAAPHLCAADGTTTTHGVADFTFEVVRASLERGDDLAPLLLAIDDLLAAGDRPLARAFERGFLERTRELSLTRLDALRPLLGPRARAYWDLHLALGEPRFGAWDESSEVRLLPTTTLRRDDPWGWRVAMPRGDLGRTIHEVLTHDGRLVGEDDTTVDDLAVSARWTWNGADPSGDYVLDLTLDDRPLARFAFTVR